MSPMCQYSASDGFATDWHMVHLGTRAVGGTGLVIAEATAVSPEGRITPGDLGLWSDEHIYGLNRIVSFIHQQDAVAGIQLAHAGRKASCAIPREGGRQLDEKNGGWQTVAPSSIPFSSESDLPEALNKESIAIVIEQFKNAAKRAFLAGFKIVEVHAAHGYLIHQFLSPLSNHRTDRYGGSLENRLRLVLEVAERLRRRLPAEMPLFVRISATDWVEGGWDSEQSIALARELAYRFSPR